MTSPIALRTRPPVRSPRNSRSTATTELAVGADESIYVIAASERLRAFTPDGHPLGFPFGRPAAQVPCPPPPNPAVIGGPSQIPAAPDWQTFLISRASATASGVSLTLVTTVSGRATISVSVGRRVLSPVTTRAVRAGSNELRVRMKLKPGTYTIKVGERAARSKQERVETSSVTRGA